ncbi:2929_t:CDS:2 [Gigaspora rosea]|nr:2929_t:CDS:2 [Gigaspora rosea]
MDSFDSPGGGLFLFDSFGLLILLLVDLLILLVILLDSRLPGDDFLNSRFSCCGDSSDPFDSSSNLDSFGSPSFVVI